MNCEQKHSERPDVEAVIQGLRYQKIAGDGHCLFNAIGIHLGKTPEELRREVAEYLEKHPEEFQDAITASNQSREEYIRRMRETAEWGGHLEIEIIQRLTDRPVVIIRPDSNPTLPDNLKDYQGEPIFVFYNGSNHYDGFILDESVSGRDLLAHIQSQIQQGQKLVYHPVKPLDEPSTLIPSFTLHTTAMSEEDIEGAWLKAEVDSFDLQALFESSSAVAGASQRDQPEEQTTQALLVSALQAYYRTKANRSISKPGTAEMLPIESAYIRLALICEKRASDAKQEHKMIFGEAGVGKSVLSQWLAFHWAKEDQPLWGGASGLFKAVFWLRLKDLPKEGASEGFFERVLIQKCLLGNGQEKPSAEALASWLSHHRDEVLFVLDGYDEVADLASDTNHTVTPFIKEALSYRHVVMTSRPYRYHKIVEHPLDSFCRYRNMGFRASDIEKYVRIYFEGEPQKQLSESLCSSMQKHPIVQSMARIPLQLGMLCWLWKEAAKQKTDLPETITLSVLYREITEKRLQQLQGLNAEDAQYIQRFLSELAYKGLKSDVASERYRFSNKTIESRLLTLFGVSVLSEKQVNFFFNQILRLGMLKAEKGSNRFDQEDVYYFTHLTYQEYYAAYHLIHLFRRIRDAKEHEREITQLVGRYKLNPRYMRVWWFTAGILGPTWREAHREANMQMPASFGTTEKDAAALDLLKLFFNELQQGVRDLLGAYELGLFVRCVEEAQLEPHDFSEHFPQIELRLKQSLKMLQGVFKRFPGVRSQDVQGYPYLHQLSLSPQLYRGITFAVIPSHPAQDLVPLSLQTEKVDLLLEQCGDQDSWVRFQAAKSLAGLSAVVPEAERFAEIDVLLKQCSDKNRRTHQQALLRLESLRVAIPEAKRAAVVDVLLKRCGDPGLNAVEKVVEIMVNQATGAVGGRLILEQREMRLVAAKSLARLLRLIPEVQRSAVVEVLLKRCADQDADARQQAAKNLGLLSAVIPEAQAPLVVEALLKRCDNDPSTDVRSQVAASLGKLSVVIPEAQRAAVVDVLVKQSADQDWDVGQQAARSLAKLSAIIPESRCAAVVNVLLQRYGYQGSHLRQQVAKDLGLLLAVIPQAQLPAVLYFLGIKRRLDLFFETISEAERVAVVVNVLLKRYGYEDSDVHLLAAWSLGGLSAVIPEAQRPRVVEALLNGIRNASDSVYDETTITALTQHAPYLSRLSEALQLKVVITVLLNLKKFSQEDSQSLLLACFRQNRELFFLSMVLCFHSDFEIATRSFMLLSSIAATLNLHEDWRWRFYLSLVRGFGQGQAADKVVFNRIDLEEVANFLRLLLSAYNDDNPEVTETGCAVVIYLCYAHQLVLSIEEAKDRGGAPGLILTRQESSARVSVPSDRLEASLLALRKVACNNIELDTDTQKDRVFPSPEMLIRNQRLWGLLRLSSQTEIAQTKSFDSLLATKEQNLKVTRDRWVVSVGAQQFGLLNSHAFLLIEGMDDYGRGLFLRYDLALDRSAPQGTKRYIVIAQKKMQLEEQERQEVLITSILKSKRKSLISCPLDREREGASLIKALEADVGKDMTSFYSSLGNFFASLQYQAQGDIKRRKMNCLTWVLMHLKQALGNDKFGQYFGELEKGPPVPARIQEVGPPRRCLIM